MGKEDNILRKVGTKNPFSVPDGYFEKFSEELTSRLPEKETVLIPSEPTLWERVKPWIYMVAMFCGIMLSVRVFVGVPQKEDFPSITLAEAESIEAEEWENIVRMSRLDDYDLYQLLTDTDN